MSGALILADQPSGAGDGTAGFAREDIWKDQEIDLSCPEPGNTSYAWYILSKPKSSTATLDTPIDATASFTPDKVGTYRIRLIVNGGGTGNTSTLVFRCRFDSTGALLERGWALPAIGEVEGEANYTGNDRSWAEPIESMRDDILAYMDEIGPSATVVFKPGGVAAGNVFDDWSLLMANFALAEGTVEILIDDSVTSPAVIPEGEWDLEDRAVIVGLTTTTVTELTIGDGAATILQNPSAFKNLKITNATDGYITSTAGLLFDAEEVEFVGADAAGRLILAPNGSKIHMRGKSMFTNSTTEIVFELADGALIDGGTAADIFVEDFSSIATDTLKVYATDELIAYLSNSAVLCSDSQTDVAGTLDIVSPPAYGVNTFIFQPGGTPVSNIYDTWSLLMTALAESIGPRIIEFDASQDGNSRCDIPSGTWNLGGNTVLRGKPTALGEATVSADVLMADGAIFQNALLLEGYLSIYSSSTGGVFTWSGQARRLVLRDTAAILGDALGGEAAPTAPLIAAATTGILLEMHDLSVIGAGASDQKILYASSGADCSVDLFDKSTVGASDGGVGTGYALDTDGGGATITVNFHDQAVHYSNEAVTGLTKKFYSVRRYVVDLTKGVVTNATTTPASCGAGYVSRADLPQHGNLRCKFRAIIETTSGTAGYEAYIDLYDVHGQLNSGTPQVITGSQLDTGTSSPPAGAPTPNSLVPSVYEVDLTESILYGTWESDIAVFEARVWLGADGGGNAATCKSAELVFEWSDVPVLIY